VSILYPLLKLLGNALTEYAGLLVGALILLLVISKTGSVLRRMLPDRRKTTRTTKARVKNLRLQLD
jgi:hypothetical protein